MNDGIRELKGRTSNERWFRVLGGPAVNPILAIAKVCPEGSPHPWSNNLRVKGEPVVTGIPENGIWRVRVDYEYQAPVLSAAALRSKLPSEQAETV